MYGKVKTGTREIMGDENDVIGSASEIIKGNTKLIKYRAYFSDSVAHWVHI